MDDWAKRVKNGIGIFLLLTRSEKPGKLGDLDKCDIVDALDDKRVYTSIMSSLVSGG
jgi:hypothetical protein